MMDIMEWKDRAKIAVILGSGLNDTIDEMRGRLDVGDLIKDTGSQSLYTLLYRPFQLFDGTP